MPIFILDRNGLLGESLRELAERRLLFALSRFDSRISQVQLIVSDQNGPRGGIDKACRVSISLRGAADVIVSDQDSDLGRCLTRLAERAGRAVTRTIDKMQAFDRVRPSIA